jgi:D-serine deaminase-like pyridoxal phosphate-dependent protein
MFHARGSVVDELSAGSCMVMPSDFDTPRLAGFRAALFVAAPVLKVSRSATAHAGGWLDRLRSRRDPNQARAIFLYGGKWMALPIEPPGLRRNPHHGASTNQELLNGSERTALEPDDHVFLRPTQSESLMLQLGDLLVLRDQRIVACWPVLPSTERG